jgi:putative ABC transport system permease protein
MFKLTVRGLRSHLLRLGATALAVVLGVSFMVGTTVLGDTVKAGFDEAFADVNLGVDAVVRSDREIPTPFGAERVRIDATVVEQLSGEPNVAAVAGQVRRPIRLIDTAGEPIGNPNAGPPTFGLNWSEVPELNNWDLVAGTAPTPGTLVLDRRTATDANISVGDSIGVDIASGTRQFTVSGIATFGEIDNFAGAPAALLSTAEAQELLAEPGTFDWITVAGANGIDQAELVAGLSGSLPDGTEAITGEAFSDESAGPFRDFINQFTTFITAFGVIALFVGGFIIFNTFAVLVAQRMRELALLRAVGASRGQVLGSVLGEAALVGVVASAIGAVAGVALAAGLRQLLDALGLELPPRPLALESAAFILPVTLGIVITVLSALLPALRASRVAPVEAMGAAAIDTSARSTPRLVVGAIAAVGAGVMVAIGWSAEPTRALQLIGAGLVATFVAVTALGPLYLRPLAGFIGAPLRAITGITGQLATENARRNPARTSSTTAALTIGIGLVTVIAIAAASASASVASATQRSFTSDLIVTPDSFLGLSPQVAEDIDALDEVDVATGLRFTFAGVDQPSIGPQGDPAVPDGGDPTLGLEDLRGATVLGIQPDRIDGLVDFEVTSGSLDDLTGATVAVSADEASKLGVGVGDQVTLSFQATGEQSFTVVAVYGESPLLRGGGFITSHETFDANVPPANRVDQQVLIEFAPGVDPTEGRRAVEQVVAAYPTAEVADLADLTASRAAQVDQSVALLYALLALSLFIALIGVVNTLLLAVYERTREIGLLRAVGTKARQIAAMIVQEAMVIAIVGTVLGLAIGLGFGVALFGVLTRAEPTFSVLSIPVDNLVVIVIMGTVAGVMAGLYPAWRASRLVVLDAIGTE